MNDYHEPLRDSIIREVLQGDLAICDIDPGDFGYDDIGSGLFNPDSEKTWDEFLSDTFGYEPEEPKARRDYEPEEWIPTVWDGHAQRYR